MLVWPSRFEARQTYCPSRLLAVSMVSLQMLPRGLRAPVDVEVLGGHLAVAMGTELCSHSMVGGGLPTTTHTRPDLELLRPPAAGEQDSFRRACMNTGGCGVPPNGEREMDLLRLVLAIE